MIELVFTHKCDAMPHGMSVWRYEGEAAWSVSLETPSGQAIIHNIRFCPYCGLELTEAAS